jgi:hypothetical protein
MIRHLLFLSALGVLVLSSPAAVAETVVYYAPHTGHSETFDSASPGKFSQSNTVHARVGGATRGGTVTFSVTYNDVVNNTGVGFDAGGGLDAMRQATAEAVLAYVADVLNETTGANVSVRFENSQMDGTGFLAAAGTFFFVGTGFSSGIAHQHITSGTDPDGGIPDITCTVDFGFTWNSDLGAPAGPEFDLFTVLLHEITHGLGFLNGSNASGASTIGGRYGNLARLTHEDNAPPVGTGPSTALWVMPGVFSGTSGDLIGGALVFTGSNAVASFGSNPTIYSENPFSSGSSLAHWGDDHASTAVMPRFVFNGVQFREYADFEIGALRDLGYANAAGTTPPEPPDSDEDLLSDDDEINIHGTDPNNSDTDGDGVLDGIEVDLGFDPLDNLDFPLLPLHTGAIALAVFAIFTVGGFTLYRVRRRVRVRG